MFSQLKCVCVCVFGTRSVGRQGLREPRPRCHGRIIGATVAAHHLHGDLHIQQIWRPLFDTLICTGTCDKKPSEMSDR